MFLALYSVFSSLLLFTSWAARVQLFLFVSVFYSLSLPFFFLSLSFLKQTIKLRWFFPGMFVSSQKQSSDVRSNETTKEKPAEVVEPEVRKPGNSSFVDLDLQCSNLSEMLSQDLKLSQTVEVRVKRLPVPSDVMKQQRKGEIFSVISTPLTFSKTLWLKLCSWIITIFPVSFSRKLKLYNTVNKILN